MTTSPIVSSVGRKASLEAFVFKDLITVNTVKPRTIIYIDGVNLYMGCLKTLNLIC